MREIISEGNQKRQTEMEPVMVQSYMYMIIILIR